MLSEESLDDVMRKCPCESLFAWASRFGVPVVASNNVTVTLLRGTEDDVPPDCMTPLMVSP